MADKKKEPDETLSEVLTGRERFINQYWDYTSTLDTAEQKGEKKGIKKGVKQEKEDTARRMKADGMTAELIAKYTGLTADEIEGL